MAKKMRIILACLSCALFAAQARANVPVEIEGATSPSGKYILEVVGAGGGQKSRVEIKTLPARKVVGKIPESDFDEEGVRYALHAVWNENSTAFALNISEGRNITFCRVFAEIGGAWKEAALPEKAIDRVRAKANTEGGKYQNYLSAEEWSSPKKLSLHVQGNTGEVYVVICRLTGGVKPRLEFVETIAPEAEVSAE
jgi:hypothetical protein